MHSQMPWLRQTWWCAGLVVRGQVHREWLADAAGRGAVAAGQDTKA